MGAKTAVIGFLLFLLAGCGPDTEAELARLSDTDSAVRREAALALGSVRGRPDVKDALLEALDDDDDGVRDAAATALFRIDPMNLRAAVDGAEEALGASFAEVLPDAVEAAYEADDLGMLSALPTAMVFLAPHGEDVLRGLLAHDREVVRSWAADGLARQPALSDPTVKLLEESLDDDEEIVVISALCALRTAGPRAATSLDRIVKLLSGPGGEAPHTAAAELLGAIGPEAAPAIPTLVDALSDESYDVSSSAADALAAIGGAAAPALAEALSAENAEVRTHAAYALADMGAEAAPAADALSAHVADPLVEAGLRGKCALALGKIGPRAAGATEALAGLLTATGGDEEETVWMRVRAAEALGLIGPGAAGALPGLRAAMESADEELVVASSEAVSLVSGEYDAPVAALLGVIRETQSEGLCERAAEAIGQMGAGAGDLAWPPLVTLLVEGGCAAPLAIAKTLRALLKDPIPELTALLDGAEDPAARILAALALSRVHPPALGVLAEQLADERPAAREFAAQALGATGPDAADAIPELLELLVDPSEDVRMAAAWAIAAIDPERAAKSREIERICFGGSITNDELRRIARTIWEAR